MEVDLRVPLFFSDHLVLQRDVPLPVWGWAAPGEIVTVCLAGQSKNATAADDGRWMVRLDPLPATAAAAAPLTLEISGRQRRIECREVLVGEVWLCSGQSNMEYTVSKVTDAGREIAAADFPRIRQFLVPHQPAPEPQDGSSLQSGCWRPATPRTARDFTAVGFFFAGEVSRALGGMPIGLINSSWGGTPIEPWMPLEAIQAEPGRYEALIEQKAKDLAAWPERLRLIEAAIQDWERRAEAARAAGVPPPPNPPVNAGPPDQPRLGPAHLYNGMIHPLLSYALRGVLWYQGEANAAHGKRGAARYARLFADLIRSWREAWGADDFPFYFVQLPNWRSDEITGESWAWFRAGQARALGMPNTGMAVAIDVGESDNIHPRNKKPVGRRLARIALKRTYGLDVEDEGPVFVAMQHAGRGRVRLQFDHADGGLVVKGKEPRHFEIAGADRKFHPAHAAVRGSEIVVSCPHVESPTAVRYAWSNDPARCNLYNKEGLPMQPFHTDKWITD